MESDVQITAIIKIINNNDINKYRYNKGVTIPTEDLRNCFNYLQLLYQLSVSLGIQITTVIQQNKWYKIKIRKINKVLFVFKEIKKNVYFWSWQTLFQSDWPVKKDVQWRNSLEAIRNFMSATFVQPDNFWFISLGLFKKSIYFNKFWIHKQLEYNIRAELRFLQGNILTPAMDKITRNLLSFINI